MPLANCPRIGSGAVATGPCYWRPWWTAGGLPGSATGRRTGSCSRETQGRRWMHRHHEADGSARKLLFVYPLCRDVQQRLREAQSPCFSEAEADADWA